MSGYTLWELDIRELIRDFTERELCATSATEFLEGLGLGRADIQSSPMSAEKLLMVYSHSDYSFTTDDLTWLSSAHAILSGNCENGLYVYVVELHCDLDDYYINCAAIIKLVNTTIPNTNLFLFKIENAFALGTARSLENPENDNSFCVTGLINKDNFFEYLDLFDELADISPNEIPWAIMRHSPQEEGALSRDYDQGGAPNPDYLTFLDEVEPFCGESAKRGRKRFYSGLEEQTNARESYKDTSRQLAMVARKDESSSYDVLEQAEEAERKTAQHIQESSDSENEAAETVDFAYPDADGLLQELLRKGFSTEGKE